MSGRWLMIPLAVFYCHSAYAASVKVNGPIEKDGVHFVFVSGSVIKGDAHRFFKATLFLDHAVVFLRGPGGLVDEAVEIGSLIREKHFATAAASADPCASACALIWLAGERRYMTSSARIGFHAVYTSDYTGVRESGVGNAIVGAYLNKLALGESAVRYITSTPPDHMRWLTVRDAMLTGINVELIQDQASK